MKAFLVAVSSLALQACIADDAIETGSALDGPGFTRTVVRAHADGSYAVTEEAVTAGQQTIERARLLDPGDGAAGRPSANAIAVTDCSNFLTATKLFDQPSYTGNELCFIGDTPLDGDFERLDNFCRQFIRGPSGRLVCAQTWRGAIRSLWTGQASLWVQNNGSGSTYCSDFLSPYQAQATPTGCDLEAFEVGINEYSL